MTWNLAFSDKRASLRVAVIDPIQVCLSVEGGEYSATLRDASVGGVGVLSNVRLAVGVSVSVSIVMPVCKARGLTPVNFRGRVCHSVEDGEGFLMGVEIVSIEHEDFESLAALLAHMGKRVWAERSARQAKLAQFPSV